MLYFYENKEYIIQMLLAALKYTVAGVDIDQIRYEQLSNGEEFAIIIFANGCHKPVNITADSGLALMRDILRALE